jgi:hypothetical protein
MARPERNNVDYFPFDCKEGKTMYFIEQKYGNDGYATWVKILRLLAVTNYHFLDLSDKAQVMFLAAKCHVNEETLFKIINDLCELGQFHKQLWDENRVIFSEKFIIGIRDAYKKRNNKCINLPGLLTLLNDLGIRKLYKQLREGSDNPQSKVKESKEKNIYTPEIKIEGNALDDLFKDLENSSVLDIIANNNSVSPDKIKSLIPEFKKKAELSYQTRKDFITHFKNSVPLILKTQAMDNSQPTVKRNQPAGRK